MGHVIGPFFPIPSTLVILSPSSLLRVHRLHAERLKNKYLNYRLSMFVNNSRLVVVYAMKGAGLKP